MCDEKVADVEVVPNTRKRDKLKSMVKNFASFVTDTSKQTAGSIASVLLLPDPLLPEVDTMREKRAEGDQKNVKNEVEIKEIMEKLKVKETHRSKEKEDK